MIAGDLDPHRDVATARVAHPFQCLLSSVHAINTIWPLLCRTCGGSIPSTASAVSDLPEPDSPTGPKISPRPTPRSMPWMTVLPAPGFSFAANVTARFLAARSGVPARCATADETARLVAASVLICGTAAFVIASAFRSRPTTATSGIIRPFG